MTAITTTPATTHAAMMAILLEEEPHEVVVTEITIEKLEEVAIGCPVTAVHLEDPPWIAMTEKFPTIHWKSQYLHNFRTGQRAFASRMGTTC